jgi:hypothetical protein
VDQGKFTARRPPPPQFTRSGLTRTYLPAVARPLSCVVWVGEGQDVEGQDVEMAKLRVAGASAPWRSNSSDGIKPGSGSEHSGPSWWWRWMLGCEAVDGVR